MNLKDVIKELPSANSKTLRRQWIASCVCVRAIQYQWLPKLGLNSAHSIGSLNGLLNSLFKYILKLIFCRLAKDWVYLHCKVFLMPLRFLQTFGIRTSLFCQERNREKIALVYLALKVTSLTQIWYLFFNSILQLNSYPIWTPWNNPSNSCSKVDLPF